MVKYKSVSRGGVTFGAIARPVFGAVEMSNEETVKSKRKRSTIACKRCNQRRVRCDYTTNGAPCTACLHGGHPDCVLIESKRARGTQGKFVSKDNSSAPESFKSDSRDSSSPPYSQPSSQLAIAKPTPDKVKPTSVWSELFGTNQPVVNDKGRVTYYGESWTLSYVVNQMDPRADQVHYTIPEHSPLSGHPRLLEQLEQIDLQRKGCYTLPTFELQLRIVENYFRYVHPAYPLLDREEFMDQLHSRTCSVLRLQIVLYMGINHSDMDLINDLGYENRLDAVHAVYTRARTLVEADAETDKICVVQAYFFLQFYWVNPADMKGTWYWLGCAVRLAQTLGMHRSIKRSKMSLADQATWKVSLPIDNC
jgi:hypothetical protein